MGQIFLPHQVHYSMLLTSGYPLAGCSPAEPASVSPDTFYTRFFFRLKFEALLSPPKSVLPRQIPSSLTETDNILFHRMKQSRIKRFFCFHNGPRNDQQLCRKFYSHLDFDTALFFSSLQSIGKILNEVIVS